METQGSVEEATANLAWSGYSGGSVLSHSGLINLCKISRDAESSPGWFNMGSIWCTKCRYSCLQTYELHYCQPSAKLNPFPFLYAICPSPLFLQIQGICRSWPCWTKSNNLTALFKTQVLFTFSVFCKCRK